MPFETSPRSLPFVMCTPPGSQELCWATGTRSPSCTFCAPVTICTGSPAPTSIWQTHMWSEFVWRVMDTTRPTTTLRSSASSRS